MRLGNSVFGVLNVMLYISQYISVIGLPLSIDVLNMVYTAGPYFHDMVTVTSTIAAPCCRSLEKPAAVPTRTLVNILLWTAAKHIKAT